MNLVDLTKFLIENLVNNPDDIEIKEVVNGDFITIEVLVNSADMGAVIGKGGNIANAIRTLVQASAYANNKQRVRINIDTK